jgi:hypothetical protein
MKNLLTGFAFLAMLVLATASAQAGGSKGSIGVGVEHQLSGTTGISGDYDAGTFHVGALLGVDDPGGPGNTDIDLGAHFYWHLHTTAMSDFGLGGALGLRFLNQGGDSADDLTAFYVEPGFQIRAFIAANVALSFTAGFTVGLADADGFTLLGDFNGEAGFHYYFF